MSRASTWILIVTGLGLSLRLYHFWLDPSVWQDEAALMLNVIELPFSRLLGPLHHTQAAPPLFLLLERAAVELMGDSAYSLRLIPFLASCAALLLFARLMSRALPGRYGVLAVLLFACSDRLLWHSVEAKPYSVDVLVTVLGAYWFVYTESWSLAWRCFLAGLVLPVMIWLSFPACFVAGAALVALLPALRTASWTGRGLYVLLGCGILGSFIVLMLGPAANQRDPELDAYWVGHFANWKKPWTVPIWIIYSTFEVARYCFLPYGQLLVPLMLTGGWVMLRRGEGARLIIAILPMGLALLAGLMQKYPYGSSRLELFASPGIAWLAALGVQYWLPRFARLSRWLQLLLVLALLTSIGQALFRTILPWRRPASDQASAYLLYRVGPTDRVLVNHWEYEYYFRNQKEGWRFWTGVYLPTDIPSSPDGSIWILHNSEPPLERFVFPPPEGWQLAETLAFPGVRLFRLERTVAEPP